MEQSPQSGAQHLLANLGPDLGQFDHELAQLDQLGPRHAARGLLEPGGEHVACLAQCVVHRVRIGGHGGDGQLAAGHLHRALQGSGGLGLEGDLGMVTLGRRPAFARAFTHVHPPCSSFSDRRSVRLLNAVSRDLDERSIQ